MALRSRCSLALNALHTVHSTREAIAQTDQDFGQDDNINVLTLQRMVPE